MKSHIQMPYCVQKEFVNEKLYFYRYDVKQRKGPHKGFPKTTDTEQDFYSKDMEMTLNLEIETPLKKLLEFSKQISISRGYIEASEDMKLLAIRFAKSLIARSNTLREIVVEKSLFSVFINSQTKHDIVVAEALHSDVMDKTLFNKFDILFCQNRTEVPFVLPTIGLFDFRMWNSQCMAIPLNPHCLVLFIESSKNKDIQELNKHIPVTLYIRENDVESVHKINKYAFYRQMQANTGYVISCDKSVLEKQINEYDPNITTANG